jgi:hypothetical protein
MLQLSWFWYLFILKTVNDNKAFGAKGKSFKTVNFSHQSGVDVHLYKKQTTKINFNLT